MGVFAWFRRGGRGAGSSGASAEDAPPPLSAQAIAEAETVTIPKQTVAAEAADSETGEGARQ
jgi:hypothetical protein